MIHLDEDIFDIVKNGSKDVEIRLFDEKRKKLKVGDKIIFVKRPDGEKIEAIITNLKKENNFNDLIKNYDIKRIYKENYSYQDFLKILSRFYTHDLEKQFGVIAIEFKILS